MLSREERVKSFAHKNLKRLKYYDDVSEYQGKIPTQLDHGELIGVYTNSPSDRIFVLLYGLYSGSIDQYIPYDRIISLETNREKVGKINTNTIFISLRNNDILSLKILGRKIITVGEVTYEVGELWEFYSFLKRLYSK